MSGTLSCTIDATGIHAPQYSAVLDALVAQARSIWGADLYLEPDSQDLQHLAIFALAIHNNNSLAVSVYNSLSPTTAQGVGLSSVVKFNGIVRQVPTNSQVDLLIGGTVGTTIINGVVTDVAQNKWNLPGTVVIPLSGQGSVTAICATPGAVQAAPGEINNIFTPTLGWQSATNPLAATVGAPVETDAALRLRQARSTALPSKSVKDGLTGAVADLLGVLRLQNYENDTDLTDANGQPPHSIAMVVDGGDDQTIADTILLKKAPGVGTYGTTLRASLDIFGRTNAIHFFRPTQVPISGILTIRPLLGYSTIVGIEIIAAITAYINALNIGDPIYVNRLFVPMSLSGIYQVSGRPGDGSTYDMLSIQIARDHGTPASNDIALAFNEATVTDITQWTLNFA